MQNRRSGEAPLQSRGIVGTGMKLTKVLAPKCFSGHVESEEAFGTEHRHNALTVGRGSGIAMGRFGMAFQTRYRFVAEFVPKNFAGCFIEGKQPPLVRLFLGVGIAAAIKSNFLVGFGAWLD